MPAKPPLPTATQNGKPLMGKPPKARSEWARLRAAARYSTAGLCTAVRDEPAARFEAVVVVVSLVLVWWVAKTPLQGVMLVGSVVLVLVVELLNSAMEQTCDLITTDYHPAIKKAKDYGSAAVVLASLCSAGLWLAVFFQ